jgi:methylated-DNA-[protein]-cysteine S-methyltransferase
MYTRHAAFSTAELGTLTIVASDAAVVGIYFPDHWTKPDQTAFGDAVELTSDRVLSEAARQLQQYLRGERTTFDFPTAAQGSPFGKRVWALLNAIPFGETTTYGELADQVGGRSLARRVGWAVGHNPLSIVVGCHRVVGKDGKLTGYAGGLARKQFLLNLEEPALVQGGRLL